jgi:hypothetical protein
MPLAKEAKRICDLGKKHNDITLLDFGVYILGKCLEIATTPKEAE